MRIGMMADVYKPHISGITNYIALNKKALETLGHEVYIFTFGDEEYEDDETHVIRSPGLPLLDTGYFISFRYSQQARRLLRAMDVVHVHHPFLSGSLALRYCRQRGIPIVYTNHTRYDLYAHAYLPVLPEVIGETALEAYLPAFCRACDTVISPSAGMREVLKRFGVESPIEVVPNGVNLKPFREPTQPLDREALGFHEKDVLLIYVGRLGPEKNISFLLRSFAGAAQAYDHLGLLLVGDGPDRENLEHQVNHMSINGHIHFAGMIPYSQLPGYLSMADAFVTASITEVHPLSIIEAMASGLPVLGIQSPGVGDTVENGVTGLLAQEQDLAAFTAKMVRLVTDSELRQKMGAEASQASEQYAIEQTTHLMENLYQQTIAKAAGRKRGLRTRLYRLMDQWIRR